MQTFLQWGVVEVKEYQNWDCLCKALSFVPLMRKPHKLATFNRTLTWCIFFVGFFFRRTPASFRAQDGAAAGMSLVDAVEKAVLCRTPASLPAEAGTRVAGEAGDRRRRRPCWCSAQLHAALGNGTLFPAVLQTSQVMLGKLLGPGFSPAFANLYVSCFVADYLRSLDLMWQSAEHW